MTESAVGSPSVLWAQRSARIILTINVECDKPAITIETKTVSFKGKCAPDNKLYRVEIPLYNEIDVEKSFFTNKGRLIEIMLTKLKPEEAYWPTLTSDKKKHHWLKVDFDKWQDEDESGDDNMDDTFDLNAHGDLFSGKSFGDEKEDSSSADDEELPDLE